MSMSKQSTRLILTSLLILVLFPRALPAQLSIGQYEDEAPLGTWNHFGYLTAAQTAMGGTRYAQAFDLSAGQSNPSLLSRLPEFSTVLSGSFLRSELFAYGPINTGVLFSDSNVGINNTILDFGGIAVNWKGWGLALSISIIELFDRPASEASASQSGEVYYAYEFAQDGYIRTYSLALSRQITPWLSAGLALGVEDGWLSQSSVEEILYSGVTIERSLAQEFRGYAFNGGLTFSPTHNLTLAAVFRAPYTRQADGTSQISNVTPPATSIHLDVEATSEFKQPLVLGLGMDYSVTQNVRLAVDASFFNWAAYKVDYFGVPLDRNFTNILTFNAGAEYRTGFRLAGQEFSLPLRLGFALDPQPVTSLETSTAYLTGGLGLRHHIFYLDAGGMMGWENGSGANLRVCRAVITLGFRL